MHKVVGTPRFMTHTDSAGGLCRPCREASTDMKKKRDNRRVITQTPRKLRRVKRVRDDLRASAEERWKGSGEVGRRGERRAEGDVNAVC